MNEEYKVKHIAGKKYNVIYTVTIWGKRITKYTRKPNKITSSIVFSGSISDCYAYIKLKQEDLL